MSSVIAVRMDIFIKKYGAAAIKAAAGTKIFPETILTAAALESAYGNSKLSANYNNFFGIKADPSWKGKFVTLSTREEDKAGKVYFVNAKFRHYDTPQQSFANYVAFVQGPRYIKAGVTTSINPQQQFERLKAAGYATDSKYFEKLKGIFNSVKSFVAAHPAPVSLIGISIAAMFFF